MPYIISSDRASKMGGILAIPVILLSFKVMRCEAKREIIGVVAVRRHGRNIK